MTLRCDCGGSLKKRLLHDFDFGPLAGFPVILKKVTGLRCTKCGGETLPGETIDQILQEIARTLIQQDSRLRPEQARFLRQHLGLTQKEIAQRMGIHRQTVAKWETGEESISPQNDMVFRGLVLGSLTVRPVDLRQLINRILGQVRLRAPRRKKLLLMGRSDEAA